MPQVTGVGSVLAGLLLLVAGALVACGSNPPPNPCELLTTKQITTSLDSRWTNAPATPQQTDSCVWQASGQQLTVRMVDTKASSLVTLQSDLKSPTITVTDITTFDVRGASPQPTVKIKQAFWYGPVERAKATPPTYTGVFAQDQAGHIVEVNFTGGFLNSATLDALATFALEKQ